MRLTLSQLTLLTIWTDLAQKLSHTTKNHIYRNFIKIGAISLILAATACQSFQEYSQKNKPVEERLIETKLTLAQSQLDDGQSAKALHTLRPMLQNHPENHKILTLSGLAHLAIGNSSRAVRLLRKAREIHPSARSHLNLSSIYINIGSLKSARKELAAALEFTDYRHRERIWYNIGVSFEKGGNQRRAEVYFKKALYEHPTYYQPMYRLAKIYAATGNLKKATTMLKKASRFCQSCFEPVQDLAKLYIKANRPKKAIKIINQFLSRRHIRKIERSQAQHMLKQVQNLIGTTASPLRAGK